MSISGIKRKFDFPHAKGKFTAILWEDNSTTCNCQEWVQKRDPHDGSRSCKHTELIKKNHPEARARMMPTATPVATPRVKLGETAAQPDYQPSNRDTPIANHKADKPTSKCKRRFNFD